MLGSVREKIKRKGWRNEEDKEKKEMGWHSLAMITHIMVHSNLSAFKTYIKYANIM